MKKKYLFSLVLLLVISVSFYVMGSKTCEKKYHNYYVTQYNNQLDATIKALENLKRLLSENHYDEKEIEREQLLCKIQLELLETSVSYFNVELDSSYFITIFTGYLRDARNIMDTQIMLEETIETQSILESMVQHLNAIKEVEIFSNEMHYEEHIKNKWNSTLSFIKFGNIDSYEMIGR